MVLSGPYHTTEPIVFFGGRPRRCQVVQDQSPPWRSVGEKGRREVTLHATVGSTKAYVSSLEAQAGVPSNGKSLHRLAPLAIMPGDTWDKGKGEVRPLWRLDHKCEKSMRSVRVLSTIAAVGTFFVIVFGKIVRVTGASTSIPDWPLAFGRLVPQMTPLVFWEWSHRLLVLIVFITMVALIIRAARLPGRLWLYCSMSLLLLVITAVIGGVSILYRLHWVFAAIDQAFGMLFFASVVGLAVWSRLVDVEGGRTASRATDCHAVILSFFMWPRQACDAPRYVGHSVGVVTIAPDRGNGAISVPHSDEPRHISHYRSWLVPPTMLG